MSVLPQIGTLLRTVAAVVLATACVLGQSQTNATLTAYPTVYSDGSSTTADLTVPNLQPPPGGFPLVVFVHALASNRNQAADWRNHLVERGYAVWSYDVRGQGSWRPRPQQRSQLGATLWGELEMFDLAEQVGFAATLPESGVVDATRLAVIGISQGGFHAWTAALRAGDSFSAPGRGFAEFPSLRCAIALDFVPDPEAQRLPGGLFGMSFLNLALLPVLPNLVVDGSVQSEVRNQVLANTPQRLSQWANRDIGDELSRLTVPVLHRHSWFDSVGEAGPLVEAFDLVPATTPVRAILSTGGHSTAPSTLEDQYFRENADRWLDRFMKGDLNGIEYEPRFAAARLPLGPPTSGPGIPWPHVDTDSVVNPTGVSRFTLHTAHDRTLRTSAPAATSEVILNRVAPGFQVNDWLNMPSMRGTQATLAQVPASTLTYSTILASEQEIVGKPKLYLTSTASSQVASVAAVLSVVLPTGERAMISHGGARLDAGVGVQHQRTIRMSPIAATIPAGSTLELELSNVWRTRPPHLPGLYAVPTFQDFNLAVVHGAGATRIEIPMREPVPVLHADRFGVDVGSPIDVNLDLFAGSSCANTSYLIVVGDRPAMGGMVIGGQLLPIDQGFLFNAFAQQANSPICPEFFSQLDSRGSARTAFRTTLLAEAAPVLVGRDLRFVAVVADFGNLQTGVRISNPVDLQIR